LKSGSRYTEESFVFGCFPSKIVVRCVDYLKIATGTKLYPSLHFLLTVWLQIQTGWSKSVSEHGYLFGLGVEYAIFVKLKHFKV
jgi:hypothetical protein